MKKTYRVTTDKASIQCLHCGHVSHNPSDVHHLYCGHCGVFHSDLEPCPHCDEAVFPDEPMHAIPHWDGSGEWEKRAWHAECLMRGIVGGINHQKGLCTCCGGDLPPDPPELTARQAALVAVEYAISKTDLGTARACEQEAAKEVPPPAPTGQGR